MATLLSVFTNEVVLGAPGIPAPLAEHYVRNTAIDFCNRTKYVTEELAPITVAAESTSDTLTLTAGEEITEVTLVYADDNPLDPISEPQLQHDVGDWKTRTGQPTHFLSSGTTIRLYPTPTANVTLVVTVAKRPTRTATTLPDVLNAEWRDAMITGALGTALMVPKQTFTDPQMATLQRQLYNDWVISAQAQAYKKTNYAPMRVECA
jgi:hypothetical protein